MAGASCVCPARLQGLLEPGCWHRWDTVAEAARQNFGWRYRALPYIYTAFHDSHTWGCPVARPLFFSWPSDAVAREISYQVRPAGPCLNELGRRQVCAAQQLQMSYTRSQNPAV